MCTKYPYVAMISDFAKIIIIKVRFYRLILKIVKNSPICKYCLINQVNKKRRANMPSFKKSSF